jgi:prepilin signal peptidase PulO-like enzyme (type II secretory pathway)
MPKRNKDNVKLKAKIAIKLKVSVRAALPYAPWLAWAVIVSYALVGHGNGYLDIHWLA